MTIASYVLIVVISMGNGTGTISKESNMSLDECKLAATMIQDNSSSYGGRVSTACVPILQK